MARRMANTQAVETIRKRLGLDLAQFSLALGYGESAYGDMVRSDKITETAGLAAECLMRRQAPGALAEIVYLTRIVRGIPHVTMIDADLREMKLDGEYFLLLPKEPPRPKPAAREAHPGNGANDPAAPVVNQAEGLPAELRV